MSYITVGQANNEWVITNKKILYYNIIVLQGL